MAILAALTLVSAAMITTSLTPALVANAAPADDFVLETYAAGLDLPTDLDWAPNGLLFVAEQAGIIRVADGSVLSTFVDLSPDVNSAGERGLLGVAVHPEFIDGAPYVYALYTYDPPETVGQTGNSAPDGEGQRVSRLTRFTADVATGYKTVVPGSAITIVGGGGNWATAGDPGAADDENSLDWACGNPTSVSDCIPADARHHTVGTVMFGADGMLYLGNGDASDHLADIRSLRALDPDSLAGKIMRVDPETGLGLPDNPFWDGDANSNRSRVWQVGLRNPFRFSESPSGELWIGDVGDAAWEEINTGPPGSDFGWPCYEGGAGGTLQQNVNFVPFEQCQTYFDANNAVAPTYAYDQSDGPSAVVAGEFYTGTQWPAPYRGALIVADFVRATILAVQVETGPIATTALANDVVAVSATFGPDGHLYLASIANGAVERIRFAPGEVQPGLLRSTTSPAVPSMISLDAVDRTQWGLDWLRFGPGTFEQCFSDVPGFVTPACFPVSIVSSTTTITQADFVPKAGLWVTTRIAETTDTPVRSVITVDGVPASEWGLTTQLPAGSVEVCWGAVADFTAPPCQTVDLVSGAQSNVEGVFELNPGDPGPSTPTGLLRVSTSPSVPSTILVDGSEVRQFSLDWIPVQPGTHQICFSDVPGHLTPPCENVAVSEGLTTSLVGEFEVMGTLRVTTSPPSDVPISVDGVPRNQWGLFTSIAPGTYTVCAGFISSDACDTAVVTSGATSQVELRPPAASNQAPVADAGPDQTVVDIDNSGFESIGLDGSSSADADGVVVSWEWRDITDLIATGPTPLVDLPVGSHLLSLTVTDDMGAVATDTVAIVIEAAPVPDVLYLSSSNGSSAGGVAFNPEDIVAYDTGTDSWTIYLDGSDVGLRNNGGRGVNGLHRLDDGSILVTLNRSDTLAGVDSVEASDIVRFIPTSLGADTAGTFEMYFDGSDVELTSSDEAVDAIHVLANGDLILSTTGPAAVPGLSAITEHDLVRFSPTSLGDTTAGSWSIYVDGSDVGLTGEQEQLTGIWVDAAGDIFIATQGQTSTGTASWDGSDVASCSDPTVGSPTSCELGQFWDGSMHGYADANVDGLFIARS